MRNETAKETGVLKKLWTILMAVICVLTVFLGSAAAAPVFDETVAPNAVMLIDVVTGEVLYEKNADEQIRPASTTKIMTLIVALEHVSLEETITVGPEGDWSGSGFSLLGTRNGERISMKDLLYGMMLVSGNDAASAIAVHVGGSIEGFADMMNAKAQELGMTGSHFVNPHGADTDEHYVTARDMAILTRYAMQSEAFMQISGTVSYDIEKTNRNDARTIANTNKLLLVEDPEYYPYATGIKTGSTPLAMRCLVSSAQKDGMKLACLVFGDETQDGAKRWPLSRSLFDYGFINFETVDVQTLINEADPITIEVAEANENDEQGGMLTLKAISEDGQYKTLEKSVAQSAREQGISASIELYQGETLTAPINDGDAVGTAIYSTADGMEIGRATLVATRSIVGKDEPWQPTINPINGEIEEQPLVNESLSWLWIVAGVCIAAAIAIIVIVYISRAKTKARRAARRRTRRNYARRSGR